MSQCSVMNCENKSKTRGWCVKHYKRWLKHGDVNYVRPRRSFEESFEKYVDKSGECWEWSGSHYVNGYSKITSGRDQALAHRWAYEHYRGRIPDGMVIDHLCRNRGCVNPDHMEVVTNNENLRRGAGYGIRNGMRTTCIHGHEYTDENIYRTPQGGIRCRECARIRDRQISSNNRKVA